MLKKNDLIKFPNAVKKLFLNILIDTSPESQMYIKALGDILVKE